MKAENTRFIYTILILLSLMVVMQTYFIYVLDLISPMGVHIPIDNSEGLYPYF